MLQHLPPPVDDMARFAYVSGWRREEILTLRWENVDRSAHEVRLFDSKNGEGRLLPLDQDTWELFERLWIARQYEAVAGPALSEFVFHRNGVRLSDSTVEKIWLRSREKALLAGKIFHDYRRTAVRNMIRAGVPQSVAMAITGHKTDSMFRRYNIVSSDDKRDALGRVREYIAEQKTEEKKSSANVTRFPTPGDADSDKTRTR